MAKKRSQLRSFIVTLLLVLAFRSFAAEPYRIPSGSMIPTLQVGDNIFVNKFIYGLRVPLVGWRLGTPRSPDRGEVVVFIHPKTGENLIKRVVAVGGDTVAIRDGEPWVNGHSIAGVRIPDDCRYNDLEGEQWVERSCDEYRDTLGDATFTTYRDPVRPPSEMAPVRVPDGSIFVLGDNRDNSSDSRYWGFVPLENIKGRAMFVWWSAGGPDGVRWSRFGHPIR